MSNMDLKKEKKKFDFPPKSTFRRSRSPLYAIRPALPSSNSLTTYSPSPTTSIANPALHTKKTTDRR